MIGNSMRCHALKPSWAAPALHGCFFLLCLLAGKGSAQLVWEAEPPPLLPPILAPAAGAATAPTIQPVATGLVWESEAAPPPQVATEPAGPAQGHETSPDGETSPTSSAQPGLTPEDLEALLLEPYSPPDLSGGVPSAYVANWGDFYVLASAGFGGDRDLSEGDFDAVVSGGLGFGNDQDLVAVELRWNIASFKNFNSNGSFDVVVGRTLVNQPRLQMVLAGGLLDAYAYRNASSGETVPDPTGFGVLTVALPLREPNFRFNQVLEVSVGVGGRDFAGLDANLETDAVAPFGAIGVELAPNLGVSVGASGRGTNFNLSYTPFREVPLAINLLGADLFNQSQFGTVGVLTVSWGDNFRNSLF